jgi:transposase
MPKAPSSDPKLKALKEQGILNPHPRDIKDSLFQENEFFDPHDLVQVKYEMLRRRRKEGATATSAAQHFGFSRVTFYHVLKRFEEDGMGGLLPKSRGPKGAHKLLEEVMAFVETAAAKKPALGPAALSELVKARFNISIHPRSLERARARRQKKRRR